MMIKSFNFCFTDAFEFSSINHATVFLYKGGKPNKLMSPFDQTQIDQSNNSYFKTLIAPQAIVPLSKRTVS